MISHLLDLPSKKYSYGMAACNTLHLPNKVGADFDPAEDDLNKELMQCPYVPTHMIRPGTRWQRHLPKCRTEQLKQTTSPFHERALDMKVCKYGTLIT